MIEKKEKKNQISSKDISPLKTFRLKNSHRMNSYYSNFTISSNIKRENLIFAVNSFNFIENTNIFSFILKSFLFTHYTIYRKKYEEFEMVIDNLHSEDESLLDFCKKNKYEFLCSFSNKKEKFYCVKINGKEKYYQILDMKIFPSNEMFYIVLQEENKKNSVLYFKAFNEHILSSIELNNLEKYRIMDLLEHLQQNGFYSIAYGIKEMNEEETKIYVENLNNLDSTPEEKNYSKNFIFKGKIVTIACFEEKIRKNAYSSIQFFNEIKCKISLVSSDSVSKTIQSAINSGSI